jgi:hypothetical protein
LVAAGAAISLIPALLHLAILLPSILASLLLGCSAFALLLSVLFNLGRRK